MPILSSGTTSCKHYLEGHNDYESNGIWSQNWLWFLPVLFLFNVFYLLFSKVNIRIPNMSLKGAVWGVFLLYPWFKPGHYIISEFIHRLILCFSYQLSWLCLVYVMVETFRRYFDEPGKIRRELNRNSYGVYIIHDIVIGGIALLMLNLSIPSVLKYFILTVSTFGACNAIMYSYRKAIEKCQARGIR